jgi:hypothetical protein
MKTIYEAWQSITVKPAIFANQQKTSLDFCNLL